MRLLVVLSMIVMIASESWGGEVSATNVELAQRYFCGVYGGDVDVVDELATPDVVVSYPIFAAVFGTPALRGRDAVKAFVNRFAEKWAEPQFEFHESVSAADRVVLVWSFSARNVGALGPGASPTNEIHRWGGISFFRFSADGQVAEELGEESTPGPIGRLRATGPTATDPTHG